MRSLDLSNQVAILATFILCLSDASAPGSYFRSRDTPINSLHDAANLLMKPGRSKPLTSGRLLSIDALRGIAALGVVLYHAVLQTTNAVPHNLFKWPVKLIQFLSSFGYVGVFLFFVISGFCIHLQWARARAAGEPQEIQFSSFWKRRIRRPSCSVNLARRAFLPATSKTVP